MKIAFLSSLLAIVLLLSISGGALANEFKKSDAQKTFDYKKEAGEQALDLSKSIRLLVAQDKSKSPETLCIENLHDELWQLTGQIVTLNYLITFSALMQNKTDEALLIHGITEAVETMLMQVSASKDNIDQFSAAGCSEFTIFDADARRAHALLDKLEPFVIAIQKRAKAHDL